MIVYFVFQETPMASIYKTQVIDVINHLKIEFEKDVRFFTLIPLRGYAKNRRKIKEGLRTKSYIFPQLPLPRMIGWKLNLLLVWIFCIFLRPRILICRGPFASWLSIKVKPFSFVNKVVFDSRGLVTAEAKEYDVYPKGVIPSIERIEKTCVNDCDFLMITTNSILDYYVRNFEYRGRENVVIPCTLGTDFEKVYFQDSQIADLRKKYGFSEDDIIMVYSGSNAGWQSFDLMFDKADEILSRYPKVKLALLTTENELTTSMMGKFPARVSRKWLSGNEIKDYLSMCDYALMIRERSITNSVSSPTKFAEYLACGLQVIASDTMAIGEIIVQNDAGIVIDNGKPLSVSSFERTNVLTKRRLNTLANNIFGKNAVAQKESYAKIISL